MGVTRLQVRTSPKVPAARLGARRALGGYLGLAKVRLSALVVATTAVGFLVAGSNPTDWSRLAWTLFGTALAVFGANALNQCAEADRDSRMQRTRRRPLPAGQLSYRSALTLALATAVAGPLILAVCVNALTAILALTSELVYVLAYTPLKTRSTLNTLVGAICGAIPPMMGWAAATGRVGLEACILGAILFLWQIPHSLSLAWVHRADYARGGFRMLPVLDPTGRLAGRVIILYTLTLLPLGLMATTARITGPVYAAGSLLLGSGLLTLGVRLYRRRSTANARRLFLASVVYLPLLLGLMVVDRTPDRGALVHRQPLYSEDISSADVRPMAEPERLARTRAVSPGPRTQLASLERSVPEHRGLRP